MSPTPAQYRDKTIAEHRQQKLETAALIAVVAVSLAAAATSFFALYWVGRDALGWPPAIAGLFPLAIDGLAATASAATVIFVNRKWQLLAFARFVFLALLAVSLMGNVAHAFHTGHPDLLPVWLFFLFAAAPPAIVALGVHLYTMIVKNGVSARVSATNKNQIIVDQDAFEAGMEPTARPRPRPTTRPAGDRTDRATQQHERSPIAPLIAQEPASLIATETSARSTRPTTARTVHTTSGAITSAPRAGAISPSEAAAYERFRERVAQGERPTGDAVVALLAEFAGKTVTPQQGRKIRAKWEAVMQAEEPVVDTETVAEPASTGVIPDTAPADTVALDAELHLADLPRPEIGLDANTEAGERVPVGA